MSAAPTNIHPSGVMYEAALSYAEKGFPVVPLFEAIDGICTCSKGKACDSAAKHPLTEHGLKNATTDARAIAAMWQRWPNANIAIRTGGGIGVLDVDPRKGGDGSLAELVAKHGGIPVTAKVATGGGGQHYFFRITGENKNKVGIMPGLDWRGDGGYVVASPSIHASGGSYSWDEDLDAIAVAPEWLVALLTSKQAKRATSSSTGPIPDGERNDTLFKIGCSMRGRGASEPEIRAQLQAVNAERCNPPLDAHEVAGIVARAAAYPLPERPTIIIGPDVPRVTDEAVAALATADELYVRGGQLVEVIIDEPKSRFGIRRGGKVARAVLVQDARVREVLSRQARWVQVELDRDRNQVLRDVLPPSWALAGVLARGVWPGMRRLSAVVEAPTMRPDGTILSEPGYDAATEVFLMPSVSVSVMDRPSLEDARAATSRLLDLFCDFPISSEGKAALLAGLLTVVARPAIPGPAPMIVVDSSVAGGGKGLAVDVVSNIASGREVARVPYSDDDDEIRKKITSIVMVGDSMALFDNIDCPIGGASLELAITGWTWRDRVLGESIMTDAEMTTVWWGNGNNVQITRDMVRRCLLARIVPDVEHPEFRTGFKYENLLSYVAEHRGELIGDALTILRAYFVDGRPKMNLRPFGSFDGWSALVRSALVWAGQPDPCDTVDDVQAADSAADLLRDIVEAWPVYDNKPLTAADLVNPETNAAWREALAAWVPPKFGERLPSAQAVGYALKGVKDRVIAGCKIVLAPKIGSKTRWSKVQL